MKLLALSILVVGVVSLGWSQALPSKNGYVPNAETAVKIAEAVLIPIYGEKQVVAERPFKATLKDEVWTVKGTLHCPKPNSDETVICMGGTAEVKLSKQDGRILEVVHYK